MSKMFKAGVRKLEAHQTSRRHPVRGLDAGGSAKLWRFMVDATSEAIIGVDAAGRIAFWNRAATKLFGYDAAAARDRRAAEIIVKPVSLTMPDRCSLGEAAGAAPGKTGRGASAGPPQVIGLIAEWIGIRQDGSEFPIEISPYSWQGGGYGYTIYAVRDISERKWGEALVRQRRIDGSLFDSLYEAVNRGESLNRLLQAASRGIKQIFTAQRAVIYLVSQDKQMLKLIPESVSAASLERFSRVTGADWLEQAIPLPLEPGGLLPVLFQDAKPAYFDEPSQVDQLLGELAGEDRAGESPPALAEALEARALPTPPMPSRA